MSSQEDSQPSQDSTMTVMQEDRHEILYFAYGSNMSTEQMLRRCPDSMPVGLAYLDGYRWFINSDGFANIQRLPSPGDEEDKGKGKAVEGQEPEPEDRGGVYGLLYLVPPHDEARLDEYEDVPDDYQKFRVDVRWAEGGKGYAPERRDEALGALVYIDGNRVEDAAPRGEYVVRMEAAIRDAVDNWGMDEGYADRVMRRFWR